MSKAKRHSSAKKGTSKSSEARSLTPRELADLGEAVDAATEEIAKQVEKQIAAAGAAMGLKTKPVEPTNPQCERHVESKEKTPVRRIMKRRPSKFPIHDMYYKLFNTPWWKSGKRHARYRNREPEVEVLPDGTVIFGADEVACEDFNSDEPIKAVVRHDLAAAGEEAILARMIEDKTWKGFQAPIEQFKCALIREGYLPILNAAIAGPVHLDEDQMDEMNGRLPEFSSCLEVMLRLCSARGRLDELLHLDAISPAVAYHAMDLPEGWLEAAYSALNLDQRDDDGLDFDEMERIDVDLTFLQEIFEYRERELTGTQ